MSSFDKERFRRRLNAPLIEQLPGLVPAGKSCLYVYKGGQSIVSIARGIASAFQGEVTIAEWLSEEFNLGDAQNLLHPLLNGQTLVLIFQGTDIYPARLAAYWPRYASNHGHYHAPITKYLRLGPHWQMEKAGRLIVLQASALVEQSKLDIIIWPLVEKNAESLAKAGASIEIPVQPIGINKEEIDLPDEVDLLKGINSQTQYEQAYRIFRRLVNYLMNASGCRRKTNSIVNTILNVKDKNQILAQAIFHNLESEVKSVWNAIKQLRAVSLTISGGRHVDNALPDVYAAALSMRMGGDWEIEPHQSLYRGQRDSKWPIIPSIYRPTEDNPEVDVKHRLNRVSDFAHCLRQVYPTFSDDQCMAVAQHFSAASEANTKTPLIDVTWDPLVALFFASDNAEKNQKGVVDHLVIPEWKRLIATEKDEPGSIRVIEVTEIQRIVRQRACFLAWPDPESYERYVPHRIWFHQHAGLVFEDEEYEQPISSADLYPIDEPMKKILKRFTTESVTAGIPRLTGPITNQVFNREYLLRRAHKIKPGLSKWKPYHQSVLKTCAEFYAQGPKWSHDIVLYSIHRWEECLNNIEKAERDGRFLTVADALRFTLNRIPDGQSEKILEIARIIWQKTHNTNSQDS